MYFYLKYVGFDLWISTIYFLEKVKLIFLKETAIKVQYVTTETIWAVTQSIIFTVLFL